ncbi:hypothetical protein DMENIID0001_010620 [Sergentomyia squamirostris]
MRILLRSVHTAVVESNCEVPVFVQRQKKTVPIRDDDLTKILYSLFPNAQNTSHHHYEIPKTEAENPSNIKSATPDVPILLSII